MSRSYKKTPWCGDNKGTTKKRQAWKKVRQWQKEHPDILLQGRDYKRIYETYDICGYERIITWEKYWEFCQEWYLLNPKQHKKPDKKEEYQFWLKHYKNK